MIKFIAISLINDVRRLYFESVLLPAPFSKDAIYGKRTFLKKTVFSYLCELPTLRVVCSVTRLTVHWTFPSYWSSS